MRALPVLLGTARPARADHRRGRGGHRRAAADAGLLRQRRRRRADRPAGLLAPARLRHRPRRRRQVLHQRHQAGQGPRRAAGRAPTTSTCRSPSTAPPPRSTTRVRGDRLLRHRHPGDGEPGRGRVEGLQDLRRRHPGERRPARRVQGARRLATAPSCGSPGCARRAAAPTSGTSCTPPRRSSASSTTGCWPTATTCSPATRSSTSRRSARRCPGSTCAAPGRVVCLIDPVGDVYACPFAIHEEFLAGNVRDEGGFQRVWQSVRAVRRRCAARRPAAPARSAALRRLPGRLHGGQVLHRPAARRPRPRVRAGLRRDARWPPATSSCVTPRSHIDHSHTGPVRGQPTLLGMPEHPARQDLRRVAAGGARPALIPPRGAGGGRSATRKSGTGRSGGVILRLRNRRRGLLPEGRLLPEAVWQRRHRAIVRLCLASAAALVLFAWLRGYGQPAAVAVLARRRRARSRSPCCPRLGRKGQAAATTVSLMAASAALVHLWQRRHRVALHLLRDDRRRLAVPGLGALRHRAAHRHRSTTASRHALPARGLQPRRASTTRGCGPASTLPSCSPRASPTSPPGGSTRTRCSATR